MWLTSNNGIARYNPSSGAIKRFHKAHGLQGEEFNFGAHHTSEWGVLYFGGPNGFNVFYPDRLEINATPPKVVLTSFAKFNKPVESAVPYRLIETGVQQTRQALSLARRVVGRLTRIDVHRQPLRHARVMGCIFKSGQHGNLTYPQTLG